MWPFGRFSGAESKAEAAKTADVPFPLTPALPPRRGRALAMVLENLQVAVAVPASLSLVWEAHDNQAQSHCQSTGECFSLSRGERAGVRGNRTPAVLAASALDSAPENRPKGHMALSHS